MLRLSQGKPIAWPDKLRHCDHGTVQIDGVDMVLSSLTSPGMVAASTAVLRRGGSYIEVGKRCECTVLPVQ